MRDVQVAARVLGAGVVILRASQPPATSSRPLRPLVAARIEPKGRKRM
jgi:hypothetical protein